METQSTIRAFRGILTRFRFSQPESWCEEFAQKRYSKKMEVPDKSKASSRANKCWLDWKLFDESLPNVVQLPSKEWYETRLELHRVLRGLRLSVSDIDFPKGSSFLPTMGCNSVEAWLSQNRWTCTPDNFDLFSRSVYQHKALKRAFRRRYRHWFTERNSFDLSLRAADKFLYEKFKGSQSTSFDIFQWKLERIITFVRGSRFSTVPKNNEKDRPINIEPFGNQLVQRQIGTCLRRLINDSYGIDLDSNAERHRVLIKGTKWATIDLKNASDSMSLALCRFLLPPKFLRLLESSRSFLIYGKDREFHIPKKISSMGNGYTFELMTLVLLTLCRTLDPESSVFGDDIIIANEKADRLLSLLREVGFVVNEDKTFINSKFRESCGANFHDDFGYVESYDFMYPENIHDCIVCYNKARFLGLRYRSFAALASSLHRFVPKALQGAPLELCQSDTPGGAGADLTFTVNDSRVLSGYFQTEPEGGSLLKSQHFLEVRRSISKNLCYPVDRVRIFYGYEFRPQLRSKTTSHIRLRSQWAKYEMYLAAGRRSKDVLVGEGRWARVLFVSVGSRTSRLSSFEKQ